MSKSNIVSVSRLFNTSKSNLFRWLTDPGSISKWFGPKHLTIKNVENDLTINGNYSIELLKPDGKSFFISGTYLEIVEYDKLKFSFNYQGLEQLPPVSIVEIFIEEMSSSSTKLSLVQKFDTVPDDMENRTKSWENMFGKLMTEIKTVANKM